MIYAWIDGVKRAPLAKGENTICKDCGGLLTSVIPSENIKHWRHKAGDCDTWSEPESQWHLSWKEMFDLHCREVCLTDETTGEKHRADILCNTGKSHASVLELQHSNISEEERLSRELFYSRNHRMFWLIHIHSDTAFNEFSFGASLQSTSKTFDYKERTFKVTNWIGRSNQFIEKWKKSTVHVFFDWKGYIFYLANEQLSMRFDGPFKKGEFAYCTLTRSEFIDAVNGIKESNR